MKKIILLFTSILLVCLSAFGLTACEGCTEVHTHSFVNQVTTGDFLKDQATCESRAVYYYSCSCGEKGTDTFYYGEVGTHSYYLGSCKWCGEPESQNPDEPVHTHNFNKQVVEDEYLKSPATCTDKATYYYSCECGEKGGDFFETGSPLDHVYGDFSSNGDGTHSKVCANSIYHGNGFWWLRSPDYDGACLPIRYDGYLTNNGVESTREGVVPAIQIAL